MKQAQEMLSKENLAKVAAAVKADGFKEKFTEYVDNIVSGEKKI